MAANNFPVCLSVTLREEGGDVDDPHDRGGHTNRGITQEVYDAYRKQSRLPLRSVSTIADGELKDIYRAGYWDAIGGDSLRRGEDLSVFDYAVNSGPARARAAADSARAGDPKLGEVIEAIASRRLSFLHGLTSWRAFGKGWAARVARIEAASLRMAGLPIAASVSRVAARRSASSNRARATAATGPAGAAVAHQFLGVDGWVCAAVFIIVVCVILVAAYNAWRQGQRGEVLTQAAREAAAQPAPVGATPAPNAASVR